MDSALRISIFGFDDIFVLNSEPAEVAVFSEAAVVVHAPEACSQHEEGHAHHHHNEEAGKDELPSVLDGPTLE